MSTPASSTATLPPPPKPSADGVRLVNSLRRTTKATSSGFAYFNSAEDGDDGAQPDDYAVATRNIYAQWENQNRTGYFADTNTTFWVFININSTTAPVNAVVGEASNGCRTFSAYKDDGRLLFKQNGSDFFGIYYCQ
ncbi:MAG: hypothetical protein M1836_000770 [Candelina mexicana]|nr:MAG: hypothetical protein M1836_000770 [Candelina mexicana]